jgi:anti-sigma regulatory factor (Ser/Thr protein kinase)
MTWRSSLAAHDGRAGLVFGRAASRTQAGPQRFGASFVASGANAFSMIAVVRRTVEDACLRLGGDPELASSLGVAAHELFENAIKYVDDGQVTVDLSLGRVGSKLETTVRASNTASPDRLRQLAVVGAGIADARDRMSYYRDRMIAVASVAEGSGLGLARILGETNLQLMIAVDGRLACVEASQTTELGGAP